MIGLFSLSGVITSDAVRCGFHVLGVVLIRRILGIVVVRVER